MDINDKLKLDDQCSDNHSTSANNRYMEGNVEDNNLISDKLNNNFYFDNRIQELLDNQKILNTLRSIKSNHSINYEEIKALPTLFLEMQEALKKSNSNLLELKETINEKIIHEKKLKGRIKELEKEISTLRDNVTKARGVEIEMKNKLEQMKIDNMSLNQNFTLSTDIQRKYEEVLRENKMLRRNQEDIERMKEKAEEDMESVSKKNEEMGESIIFLKKTISELQAKNKTYKSAQGALQNEISNIEERLEEVKNYKQEIKEFQNETNNLRSMIKQLEEDRKISQSRESSLKDEIKQLSINNKKIKSDLKNELNEKISILKEMENLKASQKIVLDKQDHLKNIIETTANETDQLTNAIHSLKTEKEQLQAQLEAKEEESKGYEEIKVKYQEMFNDFNALVQENAELREVSESKKYSEQEVYKITDKYEEEIFNEKCEINIWKSAFIEIAKYKMIQCDDDPNIDDLTGIDKNYIYNAPQNIRDKAENAIAYFKHMIEEQEYHTVNLKSLKEALITEQEKSAYYKDQLISERHLRRKIHNRYMLLRGNLRVMCRVRPFLDNEKSGATRKAFIETFSITNDTVVINEDNRIKKFEFDYIFNMKSQQSEVYDEATLLVQSMIHGNNVCIIAYGQTCTGKTYTIQGPDSSQQGVAIRAAKELFEIIDSFNSNTSSHESGVSSKLSLSIIEIYNESIFNLLAEDTPLLNIYESSGSSNLVIPDLNPIIIRDFTEASKLFKLASKFRHTSTTGYNERSSRSHCIFSFHLKLVDKEGKITRSKLNILDLAGSERISKSEIIENEVTKKEAICINLSLHALSNVLNSIAIKASHIPYRDSKLTHFLKESLTENYNILLILHLSPNIRDISETISTLEFGTRIVKICKHKTGKEKLALISSNSSTINK